MLFRRLTIQWKITLLASLCLASIVGLLVGLSLYRMVQSADLVKTSSMQMLKEAAQARIETQGEMQAIKIRSQFMDAYQYGNALAKQLLMLRGLAGAEFSDTGNLRDAMSVQLRNALESNPDLLGLSLVFEPNALDAKDAAFVGQSSRGSNEAGRFALYWSQLSDGQLASMALPEQDMANSQVGPSGEAANTWWMCPRSTREVCVIEPDFYEVRGARMLMTSIVFPLIVADKVIGTLSIDIGLERLQLLSQEASSSLYEGRTHVGILTPAGLLAAYSADASKLGHPYSRLDPERGPELVEQLSNNTRLHTLRDNDVLRILASFPVIPGGKQWGVILDVPEATLTGPAEVLKADLDSRTASGAVFELCLGFLAAILGLLLIWLMARSVTRPILGIADMLKNIASGEGDLTPRLRYTQQDELGELVGWFNRFLDKLQPIIAEVKCTSQAASDTANQSSHIASKTSIGMEQQYRQIDQVATASYQMAATAQDVARSAAHAAKAAHDAGQATRDGLAVIDQTTNSITTLAKRMNTAMDQLKSLAKNSEQIGLVIEVIRAIAEQTNLLALNAAIEAARAGVNRPWFPRHSPSSGNSVSHTLLETAA
ncbi:chemotaxis protein [Pseudomonas putida]|uniref:Chemotaxis protein n=1 Tax=Pseudomonas putida TaxID=303 RepID=A0A2S3WFL3_PSEPU|nr:chemotaxis protein [Pseudomonas putida]